MPLQPLSPLDISESPILSTSKDQKYGMRGCERLVMISSMHSWRESGMETKIVGNMVSRSGIEEKMRFAFRTK
jgi:hypothetical protein